MNLNQLEWFLTSSCSLMLDLNLFFTLDRDWSIFNRSKVVAVGSLLKLGQACSNKKYWQSRNFDFFRFLKKYFPSFATEKFVPLQTRESWHFLWVINNSNDWIRTGDRWLSERPHWRLWHSHCPSNNQLLSFDQKLQFSFRSRTK